MFNSYFLLFLILQIFVSTFDFLQWRQKVKPERSMHRKTRSDRIVLLGSFLLFECSLVNYPSVLNGNIWNAQIMNKIRHLMCWYLTKIHNHCRLSLGTLVKKENWMGQEKRSPWKRLRVETIGNNWLVNPWSYTEPCTYSYTPSSACSVLYYFLNDSSNTLDFAGSWQFYQLLTQSWTWLVVPNATANNVCLFVTTNLH